MNADTPAVLNGRYQLDGLLGVGGMGLVHRARDLLREGYGDPHVAVAIKMLSDELHHYPDANALLYTEYALLLRVQHRHVVQAQHFDIDAQSERGFIVLELMQGMPLDRLLSERPEGLPWAEIQAIAIAAIEALMHVHRANVLHGDIKPSNLMLTVDGLRLFDFGLSQSLDASLADLPRLHRGLFAAWTPQYTSPEVIAGAPLHAGSDIYALCCVLFELCAGRHPYPDAATGRPLLALPVGVPRSVAKALRRGLASAPEHRLPLDPLLEAFKAPDTPLNDGHWSA